MLVPNHTLREKPVYILLADEHQAADLRVAKLSRVIQTLDVLHAYAQVLRRVLPREPYTAHLGNFPSYVSAPSHFQ